MSKLTSKIAVPIILVGLFAIAVFMAVDYDQLNISFYIVILFFTIYVFFFGLAIGQSLTSPVKKILEKAEELSKGNLSSRVYLETKDELAELARAFNKIAEELQASYAKEEGTEKSVGIKVKARTQELEETINALEQKVKNRTIELERLMTETKNKESETSQLKRELNDIKSKIGRAKSNKNNNI